MKFFFLQHELPEIFNPMSPAYYEKFKKSLAAVLFTQRGTVFDQQGGASGKWQPLSNRHQAKRVTKVPKRQRSKVGAVKILQDRGILRQSFTPDNGPGNAFRVEETSGDAVRIATNVEYAAINNFGGTINHPGTRNGFGRGIVIAAHPITIPARPFDEFSDPDLEEINTTTELFVSGQL